MNELIINEIAKDLNVRVKQVETVLNLLSDGNTIPFIARYRKEATGALDEEEIRKIDEVYQYQVNLSKRKDDVIRLIDEKGLLTDELKNEIMKATKLVEVEDLYRPFKEKKKTKATDAIKNGLEPLAKEIMAFPIKGDINEIAKEAVKKAKYIYETHDEYMEKLNNECIDLFNNIEMPLGYVLADMELTGMRVDNKVLMEMKEEILIATYLKLKTLAGMVAKKIYRAIKQHI